MNAAATFDPYRACALCDHRTAGHTRLLCALGVHINHARTVPVTAPPPGPQLVSEARAVGGVCGPEAKYLRMQGVEFSL